MNAVVRQICALSLTLYAATALASPVAAPPATAMVKTTDTIQGVRVADPYRWLENASDPKVQAWSDAQNVRTRSYLDAMPARPRVKAELTRLISTTSPSYSELTARGNVVFAYYTDPTRQQPMLVTLNAKADPQSRREVLDPNVLDAKGLTSMDWFVPSTDGKRIAVSLSKNGSEDGTVHVYEVSTGKEIDTPIPRVQYPTAGGSLAWAENGKGFWYTRYPGDDAPADRQHFYMQVYFHKLGSDWHDDALVLGEKDGLEKISEVFLDNRYARDAILASVQRGDGNTWAFYVLRAGKDPVQVATYDDKLVYAAIGPDDAIYAISHADAPNGKIVKLSPPFAAAALAKAPVIVPESDVAILSGGAEQHVLDLSLSEDRLFVRDIVGGPNEVRVFDLDGKAQGKLPLPEIAANTEIEPLKNGNVLFDVSTYLRPRYYASWDPETGKAEETALKVKSPVSFADAEVVREFAMSKDGTKVPVNIIRKTGTKLDGSNPTLLYGYGGYGISQTPAFLGAHAPAVAGCGRRLCRRQHPRRRGIWRALARARHADEQAERVRRFRRRRPISDRRALHVARQARACWAARMAGLLMGAVITQHPELARAVVSAVGIYDMVRVELDPNGAFNTTEFGTVKDPAQFKALYAYSPYHHVQKGRDLSGRADADGRQRRARQSDAFAQIRRRAAGGQHIRPAHSAAHQRQFRPRYRQFACPNASISKATSWFSCSIN